MKKSTERWIVATRPILSIVTTLYKSAGTIAEFCARANAAAEAITGNFEIVVVDDGSPDESLRIACDLAKENPRIRIIELSRNFGHHKAMMTGLMHASGEHCFLIDSDIEEDPALLGQFWRELHDSDVDVVYGYQSARGGSAFRRLTGQIAYWLFDLLIPFQVPHNHITVRLMRRAYVDSLLLHREHRTAIGGLWVITGYHQVGLPVDKKTRKLTAYGLVHRWHTLIDSITSFSETPLIAIFYLGVFISAISGVYAITLILRWIFGGIGVPGWLSVMISVWFLGGIAIFCIGLIGIYLSKIFIETKNRPYSIVRAFHYSDAPSDSIG